MNYELLADVAQVIMGQSPPSSTYNTVREGLPFYQGKADFGDMYPTPRVYCTEPSRIAEAGDILISVRAPVGPTNVSRERSAIGRGLAVIRPGEKLDRDFLLYFLRFYEPELAKAGTGSTFAAISREDLENLKLPLPPLDEQKRIASLLARADRLRSLRRHARALTDSLLQSVFLEMFEKAKGKMKELRLGTLAEVKTGGTPSRDVPEYFDGQIPWVKTTEVVNEVIYETSEKISEAGLKASNCEVFPVGTILIAMYGQGLTRGRTGKLAIPATTNQACAAILPSSKINTDYLWTFLKLSYNEIRDLGRGGNQPNLNLSMVRDLLIPLPPLPLQEEFARVAARVEALRARQAEAERQAEGLFQSLLAESFTPPQPSPNPQDLGRVSEGREG